MNRFRFSLGLTLFGWSSLVGTTGCELQKCENDEGQSAVCLKSLTRFVGEDLAPEPLAYTPGMDLRVDGIYGDIDVVEGSEGEVGVVFEPFNYRAFDAEEAARDELENNFDFSFEVSGNAIVATTGRHDATNGLGAKITIFLPPEFDGALRLRNDSNGPVNPGDIDVDFVGEAVSVDVSTDSLGDCSVAATGTVVWTRARCDGEIDVRGVSDELDIASTGLGGDIVVTLWSVDGVDAGGTVRSEDGDVAVTFPAGGDFSVQAQATEDGRVSSELDCIEAIASDSAKSYTCGDGGPTYVVTAGVDGVGPSSVTLRASR